VLNAYFSASRIAPLAVAYGAKAAIGFQDTVDDAVAERFFAAFYQRWLGSKQLGTSFAEAWRMAAQDDSRSSGIVLWSRESLVRERPAARAEKASAKPLAIRAGKRPLVAEVQPNRAVNYSLLHNGEGLFEKFSLYKFEPLHAHGIRVEVALNLDTESFRYEASVDMDASASVEDLSRRITLPLTSKFSRSLRESVVSTLFVRVRYSDTDLYCDTHRVQLLAVNEWKFDRQESPKWLASFVLPGDPAVWRIIDTAQKYLMALRDDSGAGFDGYQSTDPQADEPDEGVDLQVRAIWSALSFEITPSYINPPPVFQDASQRLRTPTDVIDGRRGTCIDFALLMAACLEYVEICPVIFLLRDHAFPGYWRSQEAYERYRSMQGARLDPAEESELIGMAKVDPGAETDKQRRLEFEEVRQLVRDGLLVPLESVWLSLRRGFAEAVDAGVENLASSDNFEAMVDLRRARLDGVTPLPIAGSVP
jgi:hypothetical protein